MVTPKGFHWQYVWFAVELSLLPMETAPDKIKNLALENFLIAADYYGVLYTLAEINVAVFSVVKKLNIIAEDLQG